MDGRTPASPLTFGRVTTADPDGCIRTYVGEGELTVITYAPCPWSPTPSVTRIVKFDVPVAVGVPLERPSGENP